MLKYNSKSVYQPLDRFIYITILRLSIILAIEFLPTILLIMADSTENIHKEVLDLEKNSRRVKTAHFLAAQRKQKMPRILGFLIIIANIIIFSPLLDLTIPKYSAIAVKSLAVIGASLAGVQTLFNFQKDVELHLNAGDKYANIYPKLGTLLAEYGDSMVDPNTLIKEFKMLQKEYLEANNSYKSCVPSNKDYDLQQSH